MKNLHVSVTVDDMDWEYRDCLTDCMVARAIKRAVGHDDVYVGFIRFHNKDWSFSSFLPNGVSDKINDWLGNKVVEPFEFYVEVPDNYIAESHSNLADCV